MRARERWTSRIGFILAAAGSAVGLGNVWRFPYLAGENGGGAFLIVYLGLAFTVGISVLFAELAIGKAGERNPVGAIRALHGGRWVVTGYVGACAAFLLLSFYSVVGGWTLAYVVKAAFGALDGSSAAAAAKVFTSFAGDPVGPIVSHGIFMALTVAVVIRGVRRGIEWASKWLMPALFILLLVLVARAVTLPGAGSGLAFYMTPDFSKINASTVVVALSQSLFSLSVGVGTMITYGSYLGPASGSLPRSTLWIATIDCGVAFLAGALIFAAVFAYGHDPAAGPSLSFITLPTVFHAMPGGVFFAIAFFALLAVAALTSAVSLLEVPVAYLVDERGFSRENAAVILGIAIFVIGVPSSLSLGPWSGYTMFGLGVMDLADYVTIKLMVPIGSILLCLFAGWIVQPRTLNAQAAHGLTQRLVARLWTIMCQFVAPAGIAWVLIAGLLE